MASRIILPPDPVFGPGLCACGCGETTPVSPRNVYSRGIIKGENISYVHGHNGHGRALPFRDYFFSLCHRDEKSGCLVFGGKTNRSGYGLVSIRKEWTLAHRVAWAIAGEEVGEERPYILHRCDNPPCCEISHLRAGNAEENSHDMARKKRGKRSKVGLPFGVYESKEGKYGGCFHFKCKRFYVGSYDRPGDAGAAVAKKSLEIRGW